MMFWRKHSGGPSTDTRQRLRYIFTQGEYWTERINARGSRYDPHNSADRRPARAADEDLGPMKRYINLQVVDGDNNKLVKEWQKGIELDVPEPGRARHLTKQLLQAVYWTLLKEYKLVEIMSITEEMANELYAEDMGQISRIDVIPIEELILSLKDKTVEEVAEQWWVEPRAIREQLADLHHKIYLARRRCNP